nr:hypothetical protein [Tanacetum cinerariifolium]
MTYWLVEHHYPSYVVKVDGREVVMIGPFESQSEAEKAKTEIDAAMAKAHRLSQLEVIPPRYSRPWRVPAIARVQGQSGESATTQQQTHDQTKARGDRYGLPWVAANVVFGGFDGRLGAVAHAADRLHRLLELLAQLGTHGVRFFSDQRSAVLEQFVRLFNQGGQFAECLILDLFDSGVLGSSFTSHGNFLSVVMAVCNGVLRDRKVAGQFRAR